MADQPEKKRILPRLKGLSPLPATKKPEPAPPANAKPAPARDTPGSNGSAPHGSAGNGRAAENGSAGKNVPAANNGPGANGAGAVGSHNGSATSGNVSATSGNGAAPPAPVSAAPAPQREIVMMQAPVAEKEQNCWQRFLNNWPQGLQRQGVVITSWDEQVPFSAFLTSEDMIMFERRNPDTNGARRMLIGYDGIKAVKLVEVVKDTPFLKSGFQGPAPKQPE